MTSRSISFRRFIAFTAIIVTIITQTPALAAAKYTVKANKVSVYAKKSKKSRVVFSIRKGTKVGLKSAGKKWYIVSVNGKKGFALKSAIRASAAKAKKAPNKKITTRQIQDKLASLGYLKSSNVTGAINAATKKAVRIFKILTGMKVNSKLNAKTKKKISNAAKQKPAINGDSWSNSNVSSYFKRRGKAKIVDLITGKRITIRRVGGSNHLDVEPAKSKDTKVLKKVYGGKWSWDSRAILLNAQGHYYPAAMNGMPHGSQISSSNNFKGQFCIHLKGSTTHGTKSVNSLHQNNISKAYNYLDSAA